MLDNLIIDPIIMNALREDLPNGDITTDNCVPRDRIVSGVFTAKTDGVVCGLCVAARVFALLDETIKFSPQVADGAVVSKGDVLAVVRGNAQAILKGERAVLNFLQHLSGIATSTAHFVAQVPRSCKIVDTRKTTPGLRVIEKYAVRIGGGHNHRFNLSDAVMIKDNHIAAAGGIMQAVIAVRAGIGHTVKIEVECATLSQIDEALAAAADIIMLDNMDCETMKQAVKTINGAAIVEASGNMDESDLSAVAAAGVDVISIGALTHSVKALDISLVIA